MNIIRKITTITVLICFLASSVTGGYATGISLGDTSNTSTLATASRYSELMGIEHKDLGMAQVGFQAIMKRLLSTENGHYRVLKNLKQFNDAVKKEWVKPPKKSGDTKYSSLMQYFVHEVDQVKDGLCVKLEIIDFRKGKKERTRDTRVYHLVFGLDHNEGIVPIKGYFTEEEYEEAKRDAEGDLLQMDLPRRTQKDTSAIKSFISHDMGYDEAIQYAFRHNIVKKAPTSNISKILKQLGITITNPDPANLYDPHERPVYFIPLVEGVREVLEKSPAVVIDAEGNEHVITVPEAHTSNSGVYFFVEVEDWEDLGPYAKNQFSDMRTKWVRTLVHEIGVMCGLPVIHVDDNGKLYNEFDFILAA